MEGLLIAITAFTVIFAMAAHRVSRSVLTAPMAFLGFGFLLSRTSLAPAEHAEGLLHATAEVTLVMILFFDAAQTDLAKLRRQHEWPVRMLLLGLPLAILLGTLAALPLYAHWPLAAVALLAAVLAPTDAALGQSVVTNPSVPPRVRRALVVESGLNDGLALPLILLFASLAGGEMSGDGATWLVFGAKQLLLGPLVGALVGGAGGWLLLRAADRHWTAVPYEGVATLALAGLSYLLAVHVGGNGFIAAFVAGLALGNVVQGRCRFVHDFGESTGQLLTWTAFLLIGLCLLPESLRGLDAPMLALILVSLFVVRPVAIWLSLLKTEASLRTRLFFGWFGPRGLATALFALLVLEELHDEIAGSVLTVAVNAVWISALLHGLTAFPAGEWFGRLAARSGDCAEMEPVTVSARRLKSHEPSDPTSRPSERAP